MKLHYGWDELSEINWEALLPILVPILAIGFILITVALIDLYRYRKTRQNVLMWSFIIIIGNSIGSVLYFVIGRKDRERN
ncbi:PLDc N-terminal domain-containing protein [Paenibacillus sp. KN14-4R]|uniref:PLDc N-terminal domain-containing protein n=1 Tax=Paenibacillus sp. KN14-4R TaxID=3445773 RepID=UPI003FA0713F